MKRYVYSLVFGWAIFVCSVNVAASDAKGKESKNPYIGVWQFVSGEYRMPDGQVHKASKDNLVAIKTISDSSFALVNMNLGTYLGYLSGDFKVEGDYYVESVTDGSSEEHKGKQYRFKGEIEVRIENGEKVEYWLHEGKVNDVFESEIWKRLP